MLFSQGYIFSIKCCFQWGPWIEGRLRRLCSESQCQLREKNGGTRQNIASKVRHMEFLKSELWT